MLKKVDFANRIHELDLLKGIAVILMIINHVLFHFGNSFASEFNGTALEGFCTFARDAHSSNLLNALNVIFCSGVFMTVSGITASFSKKPLKEGLMLTVIAAGITLLSYIVGLILNERLIIWFGIIHLMAVCKLLTPLLKKIPKYLLPVAALAAFGLGIYFRTITITEPSLRFLAIFHFRCIGFTSSDYYPILPYIAFYIAGLFIGKCFYAENRKSYLPFTGKKAFMPLRFLGAYTFEVYVAHQILIFAIIPLIALIVKSF